MNKITIDHFQRMQFLSALVLSPAGQPAWVRTQIENDAYTGQLFVLDHDQPKQLTSGNESQFVWDDEKTRGGCAADRSDQTGTLCFDCPD